MLMCLFLLTETLPIEVASALIVAAGAVELRTIAPG
jgi:hypothetical protein